MGICREDNYTDHLMNRLMNCNPMIQISAVFNAYLRCRKYPARCALEEDENGFTMVRYNKPNKSIQPQISQDGRCLLETQDDARWENF